MTGHDHDPLTVQDFLDGRLSAADAARLRAQIDACAECRAIFADLTRGRDFAKRRLQHADVPEETRDRITAALQAALPGTAGGAVHSRRRFLMIGLGTAATLLAAVFVWRRRSDAPADLFRAHRDADQPLDLTTSVPSVLEQYLNDRLPIRTHVIDLTMMQYRLLGGRVGTIASRAAAVSVYNGPAGQRLLCVMFAGRTAELPPPEEQRTTNGIPFFVYGRDGATAVFWPEGEVLCALVSQVARAEVISLAEAKAVRV